MPQTTSPVTPIGVKLPNDAIFTRLQQLAVQRADVFFHDEYGIDSNYKDLVRDVIHIRQILRCQLDDEAFNADGSLRTENARIASFAWGGYYFIVAFLAITALGGTCVPLPPESTSSEAEFFLKKANVSCVLAEPNLHATAIAFKASFKNQVDYRLAVLEMKRAPADPSSVLPDIQFDESLTFSPDQECFVLYSSGTTGAPKGIILPRKRFYFTEDPPAQKIVYLASSPAHWIGGTGLIDGVLNGDNLHIMIQGQEPERFWEVLRGGQITDMSISPTVLRLLAEYYNENIRDLPVPQRDEYLNGARSLDLVYTSGSQLDAPTAKFFKDLIDMPIRNAYGITEMGGGLLVTPKDCVLGNGYIGRPMPKITMKLSEGDKGEILVKTPHMFVGYLGDDQKTRDAFDADGFYKSGDYAHRVGKDYYFEGRISCDWVRFHEYKISIQELEQHLMRLPYIREAHVIPVMDHDAGGLVAALIRLHKDPSKSNSDEPKVTLSRVRNELAVGGLVAYKLPAMLRILQDDEKIPHTVSGKALKKEALQTYFNINGFLQDEYAHEGVEFWGNKLDMNTVSAVHDWGGL